MMFVILFVTISVTYADDYVSPLAGTYVGTAVITDPVGLDPLDLALVLTQTNGVSLTGYIDAAQSLAYPKLAVSPTVRGPAVSGSVVSGTISFTLQSEVFTNTGTTVSRQVVLHTGVISDDGETLTGVYSETLWGLTPEPLVMVGRFTLIRPPHLPPAGQPVEMQLGSTQGSLDPLDTISVTGRLVDFYSRAITPTVFSFTTTSGTFTPLTATTDITGDVFVDYTAGLASGPLTVTATAMDVTGTVLMTETMNLYINEPVATSLSLDAAQDMVRVTNGQTVFTATLLSQYGLPMPGETVAFSATLGTVSPTSGNTDAQGVVTTTFNAGSVAGSAAVHANVADLQETVNLQVANPYLAALRLTPAITQVTVGESLVVSTTVLDQFGEPMSDQWINFVASLGSVNPASGLSDADGHIVTTFTAGNLAGEASVQATTNNVFGETVISVENNPPTAMAMVTPANVYSDTTVILSGTLSTDPDNHALTYQWEQVDGPALVALNDEENHCANFNAPNVPGLYTFTLTVSDNFGLRDSDNVTVTVENRSPSAVANSPDSIVTGTVTLNGDESYDPDHHILSYLWEQTSGISVTLDHVRRVTSTFTAPITPTVLTFTLTVTDDFGMSDVDITTITVHGPAATPPVLSLDPATVGAGEIVSVPVVFIGNSYDIASTAFSVDFDENCLALFPTGNVTEAITFDLPVGFDGTVTYDGGDIDGELDFIIASIASPLNALPDGVLVTVTFSTTCQPASGTIVTAPVAFSDDPAPTFGDTGGQGIAGDISDGYVEILPDGLRGDANGDDTVDAGDISALVLEIFDGDGNVPADTPGGTFAGTPNSDANEDGIVDAGDISCVVLLIFDGPGACSGRMTTASLSTLTADLSLGISDRVMASPNAQVVVPITYTAGGGEHAISSLAFSVDYDADWLGLDATDVNGDDIPDAITFDLPAGFEAFATFDPNDVNGELDFFIIDIAPPLDPLPDGVIATITFNTGDSSVGGAEIRFSHSPAASFGDTTGKSVAGVTEGGAVINAVTTWHYLYLPLILR